MSPKSETRFSTYKVHNGRYKHPKGVLNLEVRVEYKKKRLDHMEVFLQNVSVEHQPIIKHRVVKVVSKFLQKSKPSETPDYVLPAMARKISKSLEKAGLGKLNVTVQTEKRESGSAKP